MTIEKTARALTVVTFITLCWVAHRSLQPRTDCLNSSYLSLVFVDGFRIYNCRLESRLNLRPLLAPLPFSTLSKIRKLEGLEPLRAVLPVESPRLAVELVDTGDSDFLQMGKGFVRFGRGFLDRPRELQMHLLRAVLKMELPHAFSGPFELAVISDFLTLTLFSRSSWAHAPVRDLRFSTASIRQGFGPVLAVALASVYERSPWNQKLEALRRLGGAVVLPLVFEPLDTTGASLAHWFEKSLRDLAQALGLQDELVMKQALKQMEVESPTRWELTVDVTKTPAWREILEQLKKRSQFRPKERILVFTPEGARALPGGLPVDWAAEEISSQKHVLVACDWPAPDQALRVQARHIYAEQSCTKLSRVFWD